VFGALLVVGTGVPIVDGWKAFGKGAEGTRLERMEASPQWEGGHFVNPQPLWNDTLGMFTSFFPPIPHSTPSEPLPVETGDRSRFASPPETGLRVTWLGHSTLLIEIDGVRVLTDPVFGPRTSPVTWMGPARWYPPPIPLDELPELDAVLISHDHYDHLDYPTIARMKDWDTTFVVPLGVGAHLEYWGVPVENIVEMDWWERTRIAELELVCAPARHASGRQVFDLDSTLWAGYALLGSEHRAFFSGDTGLFPGLHEIGEQLGPFDVTMLEVGAYDKAWPDWHLGPEQAIEAHQWVRGEVFVPIHWGLFDLAPHGWTEPIERVLAAAEGTDVRVVTPRPGASFEPGRAGGEDTPVDRWWPDLPWRTASEHPVVATQIDERRTDVP
jgi:L-ascorbate metabolism protein UlaG (beta-lactamase superfamily)